MKTISVLSWGGGTQSTALMLMMLDGKIKDKDGNVIKPNYIMFADTKNENEMVYSQIYKVQKYVKDHYDFDIVITAKNKEIRSDVEIIKMVNDGLNYRSSDYADLYQSHVLYFQGYLKSIDVMPFWTRNKKTGVVGKTPFKACTMSFKVEQIMKEIRIRENIKRYNPRTHKINLYIGYSIDEISRVKPNPLSYCENFAPLVDIQATREDWINYVERKLGFKPISSVCNMCYANDFNRVYETYKQNSDGWAKLLYLDHVMNDKPITHKINDDVFMFRWQAEENIRLKNVDMETMKEKLRKKYHQLSIFELEQEMSCMGGCFI